jgi:hypothetical protein
VVKSGCWGGWNPSAGTDAWAPVTQLSMPHFPSTVIAPTVACSAPHDRSQEAELKLDLHHLPSPLTHHSPTTFQARRFIAPSLAAADPRSIHHPQHPPSSTNPTHRPSPAASQQPHFLPALPPCRPSSFGRSRTSTCISAHRSIDPSGTQLPCPCPSGMSGKSRDSTV